MTNLLARLYKYSRSQDENFTTEAFAHLLEYLITSDAEIAQSLLKKVTNGSFDLSKYSNDKVKISTQNRTEQGITDIQISTPDFIIIFENKIEASLGYLQLEKYTEFLKSQEGKQNLLILLSKHPYEITNIELEKSVLRIRWIHISEFLKQEIRKDKIQSTTRYLLQQFLDFLSGRGLSLTSTTSPISESVNNYLLSNPKENIFYQHKPNRLKEITELKELHSLMESLRSAVKNVRPSTKIKLDSGRNSRKGSPWIGFNFDGMDSFAVIYLDSPNEIIFETYNRKIDIQKLEQSEIGNIFWEEKWNWKKWEFSLNLETVNFYNESESSQLEILEKFIKYCYVHLGEK